MCKFLLEKKIVIMNIFVNITGHKEKGFMDFVKTKHDGQRY